MRIAGLGARPPVADDVATALEGAAALLGQRPAITALTPQGRREQGLASLAGWVAKGANLLRTELDVGPGDRVGLAGPPGWPLAAVALSAWWVGATVVPASSPSAGRLAVAVLHVAAHGPADGAADGAADGPGSAERFVLGDALDGTGEATGPLAGLEQWTDAVIPHGDRPPPPARDGGLVAFAGGTDGAEHAQRTLLSRFRAEGAGAGGGPAGALGIVRAGDADVLAGADAAALLATLALRPLVTGAATVVLDAADPEREQHAVAERVQHWYA